MSIVFVTDNGWWSLFLLIVMGFLVLANLNGEEGVMTICVYMGWWSLGCRVMLFVVMGFEATIIISEGSKKLRSVSVYYYFLLLREYSTQNWP